MSESIKATRATVAIGALTVDAFMLPDGSYRMSQTQAAECIGDDAVYARNFLISKPFKSLRGEGYTPETFELEPNKSVRGQTRIQGWSLDVVYAYWVYRCFKGNKSAFSLVMALGTESLERRFDDAFGVVRTEQDRNDATTARIKALEKDLANLSEGFAIDDDIRRELNDLKLWLRDKGLDPYDLSDKS
jgi:cell division protein FtsB